MTNNNDLGSANDQPGGDPSRRRFVNDYAERLPQPDLKPPVVPRLPDKPAVSLYDLPRTDRRCTDERLRAGATTTLRRTSRAWWQTSFACRSMNAAWALVRVLVARCVLQLR